jgi:hypothetical protein
MKKMLLCGAILIMGVILYKWIHCSEEYFGRYEWWIV